MYQLHKSCHEKANFLLSIFCQVLKFFYSVPYWSRVATGVIAVWQLVPDAVKQYIMWHKMTDTSQPECGLWV